MHDFSTFRRMLVLFFSALNCLMLTSIILWVLIIVMNPAWIQVIGSEKVVWKINALHFSLKCVQFHDFWWRNFSNFYRSKWTKKHLETSVVVVELWNGKLSTFATILSNIRVFTGRMSRKMKNIFQVWFDNHAQNTV